MCSSLLKRVAMLALLDVELSSTLWISCFVALVRVIFLWDVHADGIVQMQGTSPGSRRLRTSSKRHFGYGDVCGRCQSVSGGGSKRARLGEGRTENEQETTGQSGNTNY